MTTNTTLLRAIFIFMAATSIITIGVQPILVGLLADHFQIAIESQGWLISTEMTGIVVGTLMGVNLANRVGALRFCIAAALLALLGNALTAFADGQTILLGFRFVAGVGAGLLYAYAIYILGQLPGYDRSFGLLLFVQTAAFCLFASTLPGIAESSGFQVAIFSIAAWFVAIGISSLALPKHIEANDAKTDTRLHGGVRVVGLFALLGMLFLQLSIYSIWGFVDGIGEKAGISAMDIGWAFGIGFLGGLPGAALPSLLGGRLNRGLMIVIGSLIVLLSVIMLANVVQSATGLAVAMFLMNLGWMLALTYYMSLVVANDPSAQLAKWISLVQAGASAIAPALIAALIDIVGGNIFYILSASAVVLGCILTLGALLTWGRPASAVCTGSAS
ncbi:MAG: MFS transporter [Oceanospirillaceae bacterium]|nr:MFS transporter [Oceanospirillaceae bacterium]